MNVINIEPSGVGGLVRAIKSYLEWRYNSELHQMPLDAMVDLFFAQNRIALSSKIGPNTKFVSPIEFVGKFVSIPEKLLVQYKRGLVTASELIIQLIMNIEPVEVDNGDC